MQNSQCSFQRNFTVAGICISINEAALVFYLQGNEVFIPFKFIVESIINLKCKQYLSKSMSKIERIFLTFVIVVFHSAMLVYRGEEEWAGWVPFPFYSF